MTWDSKTEEENLNNDRLHLRQILLGHSAKEGEYNVVEVSTHAIKRASHFFNENISLACALIGVLFEQVETLSANETIKIPIAVLKVGEQRVVQPELEFPYGPVTFTLVILIYFSILLET